MARAPYAAPRVSVVLPTYNREAVLPTAIATVLDQTVPVHELLVVDDGSTDGTAAVVDRIAGHDPRVRYLHQPNSGASAARNRGIAEASGDVIAFQDSDDLWRLTFLETLLPHLGPDRLVFGSHVLHSRDGSSHVVPRGMVTDPVRVLRRRNIASTQTIVADAGLLARIGFDTALRRFQDWDLCLAVLAVPGARVVHVPRVVADVRREADSISEGSAAVRDQALRTVFRKHRRQFLRDPVALARIVLRAWGRPFLRGLVGLDPPRPRPRTGPVPVAPGPRS
ncbi:glycosyltransferase family 2 protein [Promicromonospora thailandica]|uniref:Glycosyl transferase family 2 n=1 Tax=Promicromonospora thailandica TaxID=765201 RepID=A0A9X2G7L0_9MICO|nr:glycosyltransferase family 2 protein [Promicromonospora thailandica]MCP2264684.1 Glycosyl transferase family 2 [Promicromonospora thailandica]